LVGIFNNNNPFNLIVLFVYALVLRLPTILHPQLPYLEATDGFLYRGLLNLLSPYGAQNPWIYSVVSFALIFIQAILLANILNEQKLFPRATYVPAMAYILVTALFPEWQRLSSALIVNSFAIWIWGNTLRLYQSSRPKALLFNIGLGIGLASFFYFPAIALITLLLLGLIIIRPFRISEWAISLVGLMAPFYFFGAWLYLAGEFSWSKLFPSLSFKVPVMTMTWPVWISLLLLIIPFLLSGFYIQGNILRMLIQTRRTWSLMLLFLLFTLLIPLLNQSTNFSYWILSAVPFSSFHAYMYTAPRKKWLPLAFHWATVLFLLFLGYVYPGMAA
jgi:Family of unknown function (DUF6427)